MHSNTVAPKRSWPKCETFHAHVSGYTFEQQLFEQCVLGRSKKSMLISYVPNQILRLEMCAQLFFGKGHEFGTKKARGLTKYFLIRPYTESVNL